MSFHASMRLLTWPRSDAHSLHNCETPLARPATLRSGYGFPSAITRSSNLPGALSSKTRLRIYSDGANIGAD